MKGYALVRALEQEVAEIATPKRADLVAKAVQEIHLLIEQNKELLAACQAVYNDPYTTCACAEKVRAAIAKATGEAV